jgi:ADP-ribose pyrophosphatase YjhB (NUDIX family)
MGRVWSRVRARVLGLVYPVFYRLPHRARIRLVRLVAPTYTVGSVVLLRDSQATGAGRLLLLRQPPGRGWSLPAGLLTRGETPLQGAIRELAEESGVRLAPEHLRPAVPNALVHTRGRWVDMVFEGSIPAAEATLRVDGHEVFEAAWHDLDALPPLTRSTARLLAHYGIGPLAERTPDPA